MAGKLAHKNRGMLHGYIAVYIHMYIYIYPYVVTDYVP